MYESRRMVKVEVFSKWQDMPSNEYESQTWAKVSSMDKASKTMFIYHRNHITPRKTLPSSYLSQGPENGYCGLCEWVRSFDTYS